LPHHVTLDVADPDEVRDVMTHGHTRADFFRRGAKAGGAVVAGGLVLGGLPSVAEAAPGPELDASVLNFALTLEYLEAEFYVGAVASGALSGRLLEFATVVRDHELAHVEFLEGALGDAKIAKPTFDFKGTNTDPAKFIPTAFVLENTGVHAYLGQAGRLKSKALLAAAASIVTVEARHAAAAAVLQGNRPYEAGAGSITPDNGFDTPLSRKAVLAAVGDTGFIVS
jgi:hypothetical protein